MVNETGVYSVGFRCVMRWRQSKPPIECAIKFIARPEARSRRMVFNCLAREAIDPVLKYVMS